MKKIMIVLFILITMCFISCGIKPYKMNNVDYGNINYQVLGIYLEYEDVEKPQIEGKDFNAKFYFYQNDDKYFATTSAGLYYNVTSFSKVAEDKGDYFMCYMHVDGFSVDSNAKEVKAYPIICKDGKLMVDTELSEVIKCTSGKVYNYSVSYKYDKKQFKTNIEIKF